MGIQDLEILAQVHKDVGATGLLTGGFFITAKLEPVKCPVME